MSKTNGKVDYLVGKRIDEQYALSERTEERKASKKQETSSDKHKSRMLD
jgi:hypothetical protein